MEIPFSLPLDGDGFLRRACPNCSGEFAWHSGPANAEAENQPSASQYYCPYCGAPADVDDWMTEEQKEHIQAIGMNAAMNEVNEQFDDLFRPMNSKFLKLTRTGSFDVPDAPLPLTERDDSEVSTVVSSPCHSWEPVKVHNTAAPLHCLICGAAYSL
ncbi:hypothetical protein BJK06_08315 [Curtobacterium sp. BH-2-1-1]|uniref:hypothetical protein n=1 Tax=Curtobacterium sp. BH-2-1-1 TaxID=1905847 RepID=UPI00089DE80E|nr:hypothetical protein [Curtobacterium sp. BH-2-1-1]AOX65755.1 hypothetical protein BJK06_08315 [Curtobacterium sp. BH-2-1-1]